MKNAILCVFALIIVSCTTENTNFTLKGHIKGLKKGTVYLQRVKDSSLVTIDSLRINGIPRFEMHLELESPEVLYIKLDKSDNDEGLVYFFADKGVTEFNTTLKNFVVDAKFTGSKQQEDLEQYQLLMSRLNDRNLDLIKENFDAQKANDSIKLSENLKKYDNLIKHRYFTTINFAINHKESEIAPYLALTQLQDATTKYLDTINNQLSKPVKASMYGKALQSYIDERKKN